MAERLIAVADNPIGHGGIQHHGEEEGFVQLPSPTIWPLVLALGVALAVSGMVTHWVITLLGVCLILPAIVGWFRQIFPHEHHAPVAVSTEIVTIVSSRIPSIRRSTSPGHRKVLPIESYNALVGLKGGIAGGIAMTVPAGLFGLLKYHSIWYPINLLAAGGFISWAGESDAFLAQFHLYGLLAGAGIHIFSSLLVGLLYGAMLPMFPKKPILTAGFVAPLLWTGLLYTSLGILSPILNQRINWLWFVVSQIAFGLVAGFVVNLQLKVRTPEFRALPFAVRAGLAGDLMDEAEQEAEKKEDTK
jgi:hypothetical protein